MAESVRQIPAQPAAGAGGRHGVLVHQPSPGRVDQDAAGLYLCQARRADQTAGLLRQRAVQRDHVAAGQQRIQIHKGHAVAGIFRAHRARAGQHLHAEAPGDAGRLPADVAVAVYAEGLAVQLHLGQQLDLGLGLAAGVVDILLAFGHSLGIFRQ